MPTYRIWLLQIALAAERPSHSIRKTVEPTIEWQKDHPAEHPSNEDDESGMQADDKPDCQERRRKIQSGIQDRSAHLHGAFQRFTPEAKSAFSEFERAPQKPGDQ